MRAAVYDRRMPAGIRVDTQRPKPKRLGKDVLVQIKAAGVNPVDAKFVFGDKLPESLSGLAKWFVGNKIAGFDFAGVVIEVPTNSALSVGDEVFGCAPPFVGSFCDYISVSAHQITKKPSSLTFTEAACLGIAGLTAIQIFDQHKLRAGQRLLIIGASGGVGHLATQIASKMGVAVCGVCSGRNAEFVKGLGAEEVVDYTEGDVVDSLQRSANEHGHFDLVLDTVSSHDSRDNAFDYERKVRAGDILAKEAMYITIGSHTFGWLLAGTKRVTGFNLFRKHRELFWVRFPHSGTDLDKLVELADSKGFSPVIDTVLPLTSDGVQQAFEKLNSRHTRGKIVIDMEPDRTSSADAVDTSQSVAVACKPQEAGGA